MRLQMVMNHVNHWICTNIDTDKLRAYFSAYGSVIDAVVMKDPISRRSRGFGFITYSDPACVDRALAQPTHVLDSRRVGIFVARMYWLYPRWKPSGQFLEQRVHEKWMRGLHHHQVVATMGLQAPLRVAILVQAPVEPTPMQQVLRRLQLWQRKRYS